VVHAGSAGGGSPHARIRSSASAYAFQADVRRGRLLGSVQQILQVLAVESPRQKMFRMTVRVAAASKLRKLPRLVRLRRHARRRHVQQMGVPVVLIGHAASDLGLALDQYNACRPFTGSSKQIDRQHRAAEATTHDRDCSDR
jgi:hypothetical protein